MIYRTLLITGVLFLSACAPSRTNQMGNGGMMNHQGNGMGNDGIQNCTGTTCGNTQAGGFLPGKDIDIDALPEAKPSETITVRNGDTIAVEPTIVRKTINGKRFAMYGYNGQIPGPMIKAPQGATITVNVRNSIDMPTTIHWHGIRLENSNDGVPDMTQKAIQPDGTHAYSVTFPDEGIYWYHPHVREDTQQDMGLYGNLLVMPISNDAYAPVTQTEVLILDDILLDDNGMPVPYGGETANRALMGRYGNVYLVNGETSYDLSVRRGSVVRFYFTNVANARPFRIAIPGARIKLVGADVGRYERETFVDSLTLGPAERGIVDVYFERSGTYALENATPAATSLLGTITVTDTSVGDSMKDSFEKLRTNTDVVSDIDAFRPFFGKAVDKTLRLSVSLGMMNGGMNMGNGMMMDHDEEDNDGIEWEDTNAMNAMMPSNMVTWDIVDEDTGKKNMDIDWIFARGDVVKMRIINDEDSAHPMQHPMHFHGQRFLVLSVDGKQNENLVWKDTVQVPAGSTADLLFDMSNPGDWMFHCHIAEHLTDGMMGMMTVE